MKIAIDVLRFNLEQSKDELKTYFRMLRNERQAHSSDFMIDYFKDNINEVKAHIISLKKAISLLKDFEKGTIFINLI